MASEDFDARLRRVEALVQELEALPDAATREKARELLAVTLELHARGLGRLLELCAASPELLAAAGRDGVVSPLLLLHGLHPLSLSERVAAALAELEPRLARHDARVKRLPAAPDAVRVELSGNPSLQVLVQETLSAAAPDATSIDVELRDPSLVQLGLRRKADAAPEVPRE
jgi:hypothetical protein